ncbi:HAMP domain-containing histidine kinase [candidate division KSB1 bacterium]|nr:HAMP domain-containing histidine kinase [candidate division KSB1 bacterium]
MKLRWIASLMVFAVITVSIHLFHLSLPAGPLYLGNIILAVYNTIFWWYIHKTHNSSNQTNNNHKAQTFANQQISIDLLLLSYFIHYSGGLENPFIFYFIFHMVIASILLTPKTAYFQATLAIILLAIIGFSEWVNLLPHYHLAGFLHPEACNLSVTFTAGVLFSIGSTLYLTVFLATSIEQRLRQREVELAEANTQLAEQDRLKSQYVLTVSHDLRSSLSTIQSCLTVVLNNLTGEIPIPAREMISRAAQRADNLIIFVKDLLNLSRIRALKDLEKVSLKLKPCVNKITEHWQMQISEKELDVKMNVSDDLEITANQEAIVEMLSNLIGNAVRYTPRSGKIKILGILDKEPGFILLSVSDTGIGIHPEDIQKIYNDFYRAKNAEILDKNGTGLGLSIVKQIVDAHNGSIWVESTVGVGSTFNIKLPIANAMEGSSDDKS